MKLSERLKAERAKRGLSKPHMANLVRVSYGSYCRWEDDSQVPRPKSAYDLAKILGWPMDYVEELLELPDEPKVLREIMLRALEENYSQRQLSEMLDVGYSSLNDWCRGRKPISPTTLAKFEALAEEPYWENFDPYEKLGEFIPRKGEGGVLNYQLIEALELEYGQLALVPDDNTKLLAIKKDLRVMEWHQKNIFNSRSN